MNRISSRGRKDVGHFLHLSRQRKRLLREPEDRNEDKEYGGWGTDNGLSLLLTEAFMRRVNNCNTVQCSSVD